MAVEAKRVPEIDWGERSGEKRGFSRSPGNLNGERRRARGPAGGGWVAPQTDEGEQQGSFMLKRAHRT